MTKNIRTAFVKDSPLRISTVEIDEAVQQLETAYTEGRLDDGELEDRMAKALVAKTEGDLSFLLSDLARMNTNSAVRAVPLRRLKTSSLAIFSGVEQTGSFILPKFYRIKAIFGGCLFDLSSAHLESPDSTIEITAIFGGVQIFVPFGVRVEIQSTPIFGGISKKVRNEHLPHDAPIIHIHAKAIFGGVEIKTKQ
jgi:hypothetical protein